MLHSSVGIAVSSSHEVLAVVIPSDVTDSTRALLTPRALERALRPADVHRLQSPMLLEMRHLLRDCLRSELHSPVQSRLLQLQRQAQARGPQPASTLLIPLEGGITVSVRITALMNQREKAQERSDPTSETAPSVEDTSSSGGGSTHGSSEGHAGSNARSQWVWVLTLTATGSNVPAVLSTIDGPSSPSTTALSTSLGPAPTGTAEVEEKTQAPGSLPSLPKESEAPLKALNWIASNICAPAYVSQMRAAIDLLTQQLGASQVGTDSGQTTATDTAAQKRGALLLEGSSTEEGKGNAGSLVRSAVVDTDTQLWAQRQALEDEIVELRNQLVEQDRFGQAARMSLEHLQDRYVAAHEELQATNEELQSTNEELFIVNAEHRSRISELIELNASHENLMVSSQVAMLSLTPEGCIERFTTAAQRWLDWRTVDVGRNIAELNPTPLVQAVRTAVGELSNQPAYTAGDESDRALFKMPVAGGRSYYEIQARKHTQKSSIVITIFDITHIKTAQREATRVANDLTLLIDTANAPIFGIDEDGKVNEWNRKAAEITGYTKEEVMGKDLVKTYITAEFQESVGEVLGNALKGTQTDNYEFPLYTKDGERVEVLLNATTRRDAAGAIVGVVGVGQDITQMKAAQTEQVRVPHPAASLIASLIASPIASLIASLIAPERSSHLLHS